MNVKIGDKVQITSGKGSHFLKIGSTATVVGTPAQGGGYLIVEGTNAGHPTRPESTIKQYIFENQCKIMRPKAQNTDILSTATQLARANNTVTTLEIKTELRKLFDVKQAEVSTAMADFATKGLFSYKDNGTYRVYSLANVKFPSKSQTRRGLVKGSATALAAGAKAAATRAKNKGGVSVGNVISRSKALQLMQNNKGHFFTAEFVKQDGTLRKLNGQYVSGQSTNPLGYVLVKESGKLKTGVNAIRNINLQTLKSIKIGGVKYTVK